MAAGEKGALTASFLRGNLVVPMKVSHHKLAYTDGTELEYRGLGMILSYADAGTHDPLRR
jgi:hypothetical protein